MRIKLCLAQNILNATRAVFAEWIMVWVISPYPTYDQPRWSFLLSPKDTFEAMINSGYIYKYERIFLILRRTIEGARELLFLRNRRYFFVLKWDTENK